MDVLPQLVASGLVNGSIYSLMAIGYVIIYKGTSVVNFAQGEAVMVGGYFALVFYTTLHLPAYAVLPLTFLASMLFWVVVERIAYRPLQDAPVFSLVIATFAVGLSLRSLARLVFGPDIYHFPPLFSTAPIQFQGVFLNKQSLWILIVSLLSTVILLLFFRLTRLGKAMRAVSQNRDGAWVVGIPVRRYFGLIWGLGSAFGATGGVLLAPLIILHPEMGWVAIKAFAVAILGGFTSVPGAFVGGLALGVVENLASFFVSTHIKDVVAFLVMIGVLWVRPTGLFGQVAIKKV
jgi:branched-chain amino acid transport system permease protein